MHLFIGIFITFIDCKKKLRLGDVNGTEYLTLEGLYSEDPSKTNDFRVEIISDATTNGPKQRILDKTDRVLANVSEALKWQPAKSKGTNWDFVNVYSDKNLISDGRGTCFKKTESTIILDKCPPAIGLPPSDFLFTITIELDKDDSKMCCENLPSVEGEPKNIERRSSEEGTVQETNPDVRNGRYPENITTTQPTFEESKRSEPKITSKDQPRLDLDSQRTETQSNTAQPKPKPRIETEAQKPDPYAAGPIKLSENPQHFPQRESSQNVNKTNQIDKTTNTEFNSKKPGGLTERETCEKHINGKDMKNGGQQTIDKKTNNLTKKERMKHEADSTRKALTTLEKIVSKYMMLKKRPRKEQFLDDLLI